MLCRNVCDDGSERQAIRAHFTLLSRGNQGKQLVTWVRIASSLLGLSIQNQCLIIIQGSAAYFADLKGQ
jgi:hypothetical protein